MRRELHEQNRKSWNAVTPAHNSHKGDQVKFFRNGGSTLWTEERELLGDLRGHRLVHLQCNCGQDTLSLTRLGAQVTGVDISDAAIEFATELARAADIPAAFHRADLLDWFRETKERFEVVFTSYGALCWLSDLRQWADGVARVLAPGGRLVIMEFHPFGMLFEERNGAIERCYPYEPGALTSFDDGVHDYVADSADGLRFGAAEAGIQGFENPHGCHEFNWGVADVVQAVADSGLRLRVLKEFNHSNGFKPFETMVAAEDDRRWRLPADQPALPLMYGLVASAD